MSVRFQRRINVLPGLTLNLNKTGASVSIGGKGLRKTYGKNGVRTTVGIPGTGLSHTSYQRYNSTKRGNTPYQSTQPQVPIRTKSENRAWGWVFLVFAIGTIIASFAIPNIVEFGRWFIAIVCGGFLLIGALVFFTATSQEDITQQADYLSKLNDIGKELEDAHRLLEQKRQEDDRYNG